MRWRATWRCSTWCATARCRPPPAEIPADPDERARPPEGRRQLLRRVDGRHLRRCRAAALLPVPIRNPAVAALGEELERSQPKSFAAGMDMILADVLDSARQQHGPIAHHGHAIVLLVQYTARPAARPRPGCDWMHGTQAQRAALLAAQTAVLLSTYLRLLGHEARAHTATCSDVDLNGWPWPAGLVLPRPAATPIVGTPLRPGGGEHARCALAADAPLADQRCAALARAGLVAGLGQRTKNALQPRALRAARVPPRRAALRDAAAPRHAHHFHRPRARAALSRSAPTSLPARCSAIWARPCRTAPRTRTT